MGYFNQRFDITRPFNYDSPLKPIFYTNRYSYHCWQGSFGLTYNYTFLKKYFISGDITYGMLYSFRQDYTPTYSVGTDFFTQRGYNQNHFSKTLSLSVGINRYFGERFSLGVYVLAPVYTLWRNDKIFNDDPSTFYRPNFSLGSSVSVAYHFKKKNQL